MQTLISWRSVLAGLLIAFLIMLGFLGLRMAFGGVSLHEGIFTGVWFLSSALISIFTGSYFAARISKYQNGRIGSAQGLVIAALFLGLFLYQSIFSVITKGGVVNVAEDPEVLSTVGLYAEESLGDMNFRSDMALVSKEVASRLIHGNTAGASSYLAYQTGITPEEADARIALLKPRADRALDHAKLAASNSFQATGWSLFFTVILGALSSVMGGALGSVANFRNPLSREQFSARQHMHA